MVDEIKKYRPAETKIFGGILYSVSVPINEAKLTLLIGEGTEPIYEELDFPDLSPDNYAELYKRGHQLARKIIQSEDPRLKPLFNMLNEGPPE